MTSSFSPQPQLSRGPRAPGFSAPRFSAQQLSSSFFGLFALVSAQLNECGCVSEHGSTPSYFEATPSIFRRDGYRAH
eukprot:m.622678 g.622678  ORF g.622678 m.622678 type:complete len:77 (+) comp58220_c0_seq1:1873-2103(+)